MNTEFMQGEEFKFVKNNRERVRVIYYYRNKCVTHVTKLPREITY
jgi:hypothetical protein